MSFSFSCKGETLEALEAAYDAKMEEVLKGQAVHQHDAAVNRASFTATASLLGEPPEGKMYAGNASGSLGWVGTLDSADFAITSISVSNSVAHVPLEIPTQE